MPYALPGYSAMIQERILAQCPHASDVRGCYALLNAGRVVLKGQKGTRIIAPGMGTSEGIPKLVNIKPAYVFDVSQTEERTPVVAAAA